MSHTLKTLPYALAAGFVFFGVQKFGVENLVFEIIAERSGIALFEPHARIATGLAELGAAGLLVFPNARARLLGGLLGLAILLGAVAFHLSPWLGVVVPGIGIGLFLTALALTALTAAFVALQSRKLFGEPTAAEPRLA